jgi:hypothetical protein
MPAQQLTPMVMTIFARCDVNTHNIQLTLMYTRQCVGCQSTHPLHAASSRAAAVAALAIQHSALQHHAMIWSPDDAIISDFFFVVGY